MKNRMYINSYYVALAAGILTSTVNTGFAATVGLWRFDEAGAVDGNPITQADSEYNNSVLSATNITGSPQYSNNVPGAFIKEGTSGPTYANGFSLYSGAGIDTNAIKTQFDPILNSASGDFTMEFFFSIETELPGFNSLVNRRIDSTDRINIDYDHSNNKTRYGSNRVVVTDSGTNTVIRAADGVGGQVFVDTDGDTNDPADYNDGGSPSDPSTEGNGIDDHLDINGFGSWHHLALTYDATTQEAKLYLDYVLMDTEIITSMATPATGWEFGRNGSGAAADVYIDEPRLSDVVLPTSEFLQVTVPEPSTYGAVFSGIILCLVFRRRLNAKNSD